jgi:hypothetical protein
MLTIFAIDQRTVFTDARALPIVSVIKNRGKAHDRGHRTCRDYRGEPNVLRGASTLSRLIHYDHGCHRVRKGPLYQAAIQGRLLDTFLSDHTWPMKRRVPQPWSRLLRRYRRVPTLYASNQSLDMAAPVSAGDGAIPMARSTNGTISMALWRSLTGMDAIWGKLTQILAIRPRVQCQGGGPLHE